MTEQRFGIRAFIKNVGSGWVALVVGGLVGLITLPLSMKYLGEELYGVAALSASLLSMFHYLSFGLPPTILRFFSLAFAKNDLEEARKIMSTSQLIMGGLGLIGAIGFLCCFPWFVEFYDIREEWRGHLCWLFLAMALGFAEGFYLSPFFALIQARNRYDLGNYNRVISSLLRLGTLWSVYVFYEPTLRALALSSFIGSLYLIVSTIAIAWRLDGANILFKRSCVSFEFLPKFFSFSAFTLINTIFFPLSIQAPILIIGKTLGKDMVTAFAPSVAFSGLLMSVLASVASPLTPIASRDAVETNGASLKRWTLVLSEVQAWFGMTVVVILGLVGGDLLTLWVGEKLAWTATTFTIMAMGVVIAQIQAVNYNLALGASTIKPVAYSSVVMAILTAGGAWIGTAYCGWSILGVAICIVVVRVLRNTFYLAFAYSRIFGYNYWNYTWLVYCKPTFYALVVIVVARWLKANYFDYEPSFAFLIIGSAVVASVYGALGWYFNVDAELKKKLPGVRKIPKWGRAILRLPLD